MKIDPETVAPPVKSIPQSTMRRLQLKAKVFANRSDWRGAIAIISDWLIIALSTATYPMLGHVGFPFGLVIYLCSAVIIASRFRGLENLVHESSHRNLFKIRELNDALEYVFAIPVFRTVEDYRRTHMIHHHYLGDIEHDPDIQRYARLGINDLPTNYAWIMIIRPLLGFHTVEYIQTTLYEFWTSSRAWATKLIFWLGALGLVVISNSWQLALLYWLIPFFVLLPAMRFWAEVGEHGALDLNNKIASSRNNLGLIHRWLLYPHNDGYHSTHHLYVAIPWFSLPAANEALMEDEDFEAYCVESDSVLSTLQQLRASTILKQQVPANGE